METIRDPAEPLRLFVAVEIPDAVRAGIDGVVEPLRRRRPDLRWSRSDRWHVTLRFLGATTPDEAEAIGALLADVARRSGVFGVRVDGWGSFPSPSRASVLWVGLEDPSGALAGLADAVEDALRPLRGPVDHPFRPHLTVARARPPARIDLSELPPPQAARFEVDGVTLMRSRLGGDEPRYERVARYGFLG